MFYFFWLAFNISSADQNIFIDNCNSVPGNNLLQNFYVAIFAMQNAT